MNERTPTAPQHVRTPADVKRMAEELMPMFYADVKRLARHERHRVGAGNTLQTTALIHEAYLKLLRSPSFNDRAHFLRASALAMRHVLINYAHENLAEKRGGGAIVESLTASHDIGIQDDQSIQRGQVAVRFHAGTPAQTVVVMSALKLAWSRDRQRPIRAAARRAP